MNYLWTNTSSCPLNNVPSSQYKRTKGSYNNKSPKKNWGRTGKDGAKNKAKAKPKSGSGLSNPGEPLNIVCYSYISIVMLNITKLAGTPSGIGIA